jgi:23S rRNA pseudouridine1911/1915/1917 synthase
MKIADVLIFENENFLVVNKPAGLLSIPDREGKETSLKKILQEEYGEIFTVHRLDRDTSGLIVFAKNESLHKLLSQQFEQRQTEKIYLGLIIGSPLKEKDTVDSPIIEHPTKKGVMITNKKGKEAVTDYEVLNTFKIYSWVRFQIHTGRTHQIRVHMKHIGHPIACDKIYGDGKSILLSSIKHNYKLSKNEEEEKPILGRLALHAYQLRFTSSDNSRYRFEAPIPKDLKATLQQLEKRSKKFTT